MTVPAQQKKIVIRHENGSVYRAGLSPSRAAHEMFIKRESLIGFLDRDGYCVVDNPVVLEARWET